MSWFQIWHWFPNILSPNPQIWAFWVKKYQLSNLNKILSVLNFEGADFKSDICYRKFWAQIPKFQHFRPKSIDFLILTKFATTSLLVVKMPSRCYALAILFHFHEVFSKKSICQDFRTCWSWVEEVTKLQNFPKQSQIWNQHLRNRIQGKFR